MKYAHTGRKVIDDAYIVGMMLSRTTDHDQQTDTVEIEKTDLITEKSGALVAHTVEHFSGKEKRMHVRDFRRIRCTRQCISMHWYRWKGSSMTGKHKKNLMHFANISQCYCQYD